MKRNDARVSLPRPKGTRASSRATLTVSMHPRELEELRARAAAASMSLTAYVSALLASDADDLPAASVPGRRINWLEDRTSETLARRCGSTSRRMRGPTANGTGFRPCVLAKDHAGDCTETLARRCGRRFPATASQRWKPCVLAVAHPGDCKTGGLVLR